MPINKIIKVYNDITINNLSLLLKIDTEKIIKICMSLGVMVTTNYRLNKELILLICDELGYKVKVLDTNDNINYLKKRYLKEKKIIRRPPIVTILGHVNHGKTSLLN